MITRHPKRRSPRSHRSTLWPPNDLNTLLSHIPPILATLTLDLKPSVDPHIGFCSFCRKLPLPPKSAHMVSLELSDVIVVKLVKKQSAKRETRGKEQPPKPNIWSFLTGKSDEYISNFLNKSVIPLIFHQPVAKVLPVRMQIRSPSKHHKKLSLSLNHIETLDIQ